MNGLPCSTAAATSGTAAWVLAHAVLGKRRIGLVGIDLGYAPGTPYEKTQYYPELRELLGDRHLEALHPHREPRDLGEVWFSDPAYHWFRDVFLEMAREADCETYQLHRGRSPIRPRHRDRSRSTTFLQRPPPRRGGIDHG